MILDWSRRERERERSERRMRGESDIEIL